MPKTVYPKIKPDKSFELSKKKLMEKRVIQLYGKGMTSGQVMKSLKLKNYNTLKRFRDSLLKNDNLTPKQRRMLENPLSEKDRDFALTLHRVIQFRLKGWSWKQIEKILYEMKHKKKQLTKNGRVSNIAFRNFKPALLKIVKGTDLERILDRKMLLKRYYKDPKKRRFDMLYDMVLVEFSTKNLNEAKKEINRLEYKLKKAPNDDLIAKRNALRFLIGEREGKKRRHMARK